MRLFLNKMFNLAKKIMGIHIGSLVRKVMDEKRVKPGDLAKRLGMHIGSMSRIMAYEEVNTALLKKLCVALGFDFFSLYSEELKLPGAEKGAQMDTGCEKLLEECKDNLSALKQENVILREVIEMLGKK